MLQAENLAGEYIFSPITDTRTTSLTPKIHFLAFPRDLIISIVVTLRKEGKEKKKKSSHWSQAHFQLSAEKYSSSPVSNKPFRLGGVVFQLLSVTFEIRTFFCPSYSVEPARIRGSVGEYTFKAPRLLYVQTGIHTAPAALGPQCAFEGMW